MNDTLSVLFGIFVVILNAIIYVPTEAGLPITEAGRGLRGVTE